MLRHHGLSAATVAVYEMDVELLFSAQPFGQVRFDNRWPRWTKEGSLSVACHVLWMQSLCTGVHAVGNILNVEMLCRAWLLAASIAYK